MHDGKYQCHVEESYSTSATQKSLTLNEKCLGMFWNKIRRMNH